MLHDIKVKWLPPAILDVLIRWRLATIITISIILGGTSQEVYTLKVPLYVISAVFIIGAVTFNKRPISSLWCVPVIFGTTLLLMFVVYSLPIPPEIWIKLSGREVVRTAFMFTGENLPWMPMTLAPEKTLLSMFNFLPLIAITLVFKLHSTEREVTNAEFAILVIALMSLMLGLAEVVGDFKFFSAYDIYNKNLPVGVFTNVNHHATLMAIGLILAIHHAEKNIQNREINSNHLGIYLVSALILCMGLIATKSGAGLVFLAISLIGPLAMSFARKKVFIRGVAAFIIISSVVIIGLLLSDGNLRPFLNWFNSSDVTSRYQIFKTSSRMWSSFGIFGIGPGSFASVYAIFENPESVTRIYVNEAHNDYLQLTIEFGIFGLIWLAAGVSWILTLTKKMLFTDIRNNGTRRLSLLILWIVLIHSAVDYPLRTISLSTIFFFFCLRVDSLVRIKSRENVEDSKTKFDV